MLLVVMWILSTTYVFFFPPVGLKYVLNKQITWIVCNHMQVKAFWNFDMTELVVVSVVNWLLAKIYYFFEITQKWQIFALRTTSQTGSSQKFESITTD